MTQYPTSRQPVVAIDLGSNSFHLLEARLDEQGRMQPIRALARKVQLALAMVDGRMTPDAIARGLECLQEFAPYCSQLPAGRVRVVGTQALRVASNRQEFIDAAADILNHSIEVVSGEEEATLAYLGVAAGRVGNEALLVTDIGGGSTELVIGNDGRVQRASSLPLGCVSWLRFFPQGRLSNELFDEAKAAAMQVVGPVADQYAGNWHAIGCSGTLLAVGEVLKQRGWSDGAINRDGLERLRQALMAFEHTEAVHFQGLLEDRRSIFASGVAIVSAIFECLELQEMTLSSNGLREGLAWGMLQG